jgi:hypothetical protein
MTLPDYIPVFAAVGVIALIGAFVYHCVGVASKY